MKSININIKQLESNEIVIYDLSKGLFLNLSIKYQCCMCFVSKLFFFIEMWVFLRLLPYMNSRRNNWHGRWLCLGRHDEGTITLRLHRISLLFMERGWSLMTNYEIIIVLLHLATLLISFTGLIVGLLLEIIDRSTKK